MPIVGKFFPSQKSEEKVFLLLRRHWFTYFGFVVVAAIMSIPLIGIIIWWISVPENFANANGNMVILGTFSYSLFVIGLMLYGFIDYYLDVYIITNERIVSVEQNGFFRREISELHLHQIQDVSARVDGFFPTLIHYGDVYIQTAGERENFIFKAVPNPYKVSKLIVDLHELQLEEMAREERGEKTISKVNLDMENVDPEVFSLARSRTKEFLNGEELEETAIKGEVEDEISRTKNKTVLGGVDGAIKRLDESGVFPEAENGKISPMSSDSAANSPSRSEGEMHEGEEVDI